MIDIRILNNIIVLDTYPILLQDEIINNLKRYNDLLILNVISFFYQ